MSDVVQEQNEAADGPETEAESTEIRKPMLVDMVVAQSGIKKKDAKPVVEATLALLGKALSEGQALNLQPLGKIRVNNIKTLDNAQVVTLRVRRSSQAIAGTEGLETSGEGG